MEDYSKVNGYIYVDFTLCSSRVTESVALKTEILDEGLVHCFDRIPGNERCHQCTVSITNNINMKCDEEESFDNLLIVGIFHTMRENNISLFNEHNSNMGNYLTYVIFLELCLRDN